MEPTFDDELKLLANALNQETFRFILIGHNRYSLYKDIADWLHSKFPKRAFLELRLDGKDYRQITDAILGFQKGIILIPDFDWLFREENQEVCVAFNQRRDAFARLDIALLCFIEPSGFIKVPKKVPDWWSLRSLELDFYRETPDASGEFLTYQTDSTSLGGQSQEEKEAEIQRLLNQIQKTDPTNKPLLLSLYSQLGSLFFDLSNFEEAKKYWEYSLLLSLEITDKSNEGIMLNNISQIYYAQGDYGRALDYLEQSLSIARQNRDKNVEGITLNNISQIYSAQGDYGQASGYLEQSLSIQRQIGDKDGEGTTLNNISQIYHAQGDYGRALDYLEQSLSIRRQIGDTRGEGTTLNNISQIYDAQGDYGRALDYLEQSLSIRRQIGDKSGEGATLNNISQIYDAQGDYGRALDYLEQSLSIQRQIGDKSGEGTTLYNMGVLYIKQFQDVDKAIFLLFHANSIFKQIGSPSIKSAESWLTAIRQQIGEARFNQILQSIQNNPPA